jgi:hypothetical protein
MSQRIVYKCHSTLFSAQVSEALAADACLLISTAVPVLCYAATQQQLAETQQQAALLQQQLEETQ